MEKTNFSQSQESSASPVHRGVGSAGAALHSTIDKVADPAREAVDHLSSAAHQKVDSLASSAVHAADEISDKARYVAEAPERMLACSKGWVQERPLEAVGAALAIGFLLGRLTGR